MQSSKFITSVRVDFSGVMNEFTLHHYFLTYIIDHPFQVTCVPVSEADGTRQEGDFTVLAQLPSNSGTEV